MSIGARTADFIAVVKFRTTDQGGRKTPAFTSYRPQIKFDFSEKQTSGQLTFLDKDIAYPGDEVDVEIELLTCEIFENKLTEGMDFEFIEASRIIGTGKVKIIINERLKKARG